MTQSASRTSAGIAPDRYGVEVRRSANEPPVDERHSRTVELRHRADRTVRTAARAGVIIPVVVGVGFGLIVQRFWPDRAVIAEGFIVGGLLSGLFNYGQAIVETTQERRQLQIQLAASTDLRNADLAGIDLSRTYLREKDLEGARLSRTTCYEADFSYSNLRDARLTKGSFTRTNFDHADMTKAGCFEADLSRCSVVHANLQGASLCGATLRKSDLTNADLRGADLRRASLDGATLHQSNLHGAWYSNSTRWPIGYEPPANPEQDPHGRIFKDDNSEGPAHQR